MTSQTDEAARIAAIADGLGYKQKLLIKAAAEQHPHYGWFIAREERMMPPLYKKGLAVHSEGREVFFHTLTPDGIAVAAMLSASREGE